MSPDKRIVVVVSERDSGVDLARRLIDKLSALADEGTMLVVRETPFAQVGTDGLPILLIRNTIELGCLLTDVNILVEKGEPIWKRKQRSKPCAPHKGVSQYGKSRTRFRSFGNRRR